MDELSFLRAPLGSLHIISFMRPAVLAASILVLAHGAEGQTRFRVGTALMLVDQRHSPQELGGTTWGVSFAFGVKPSPRLVLEVEPSFSGGFDSELIYLPTPVLPVRQTSSRKDTFITFQVRALVGILEPVLGASYIRGTTRRHARFVDSGRTYFDDRGDDETLAVVGGLDMAVPASRRVHIVPGIRLIARATGGIKATRSGAFALRVGVGARVAF